MQFATSTTTAALLALLPLASAAPATPALEARVEPVIRSPFFTLRAATYERVEFNGAALTSYHTGAGRGWAVLHRGADEAPRTAYLNGTEAQLRADSGTLVFPFDAGEAALKLAAPGSGQPLEISVGPGSRGLYVDSHGDDHELKINHRPQQAFYGCRLPEDRTYAQLFVGFAADSIPATCFPLSLKATF